MFGFRVLEFWESVFTWMIFCQALKHSSCCSDKTSEDSDFVFRFLLFISVDIVSAVERRMNRAAFRKFEFFEFDVISQNLGSAIVCDFNRPHSFAYILTIFMNACSREAYQRVPSQRVGF